MLQECGHFCTPGFFVISDTEIINQMEQWIQNPALKLISVIFTFWEQ